MLTKKGAQMRRFSLALLVSASALTLIATGSTALEARRPAPQLADPAPTAKRLVIRFFVLVAHKDRPGLDRFLSPAFQVQRADGSGGGKRQYLANLPTVRRFFLSHVTVTQTDGVLVAGYRARVEGLVNGKPYTPGFAPRLSVFSWSGTRWQLVAHANFNPLTT
jgi:hypothetical protein